MSPDPCEAPRPSLVGMSRHRFTLAALATLAVPGLDVAVTRTFTGGGEGQHDAALLTDADGDHSVVRAPVDAQSAARLTAEIEVLGPAGWRRMEEEPEPVLPPRGRLIV